MAAPCANALASPVRECFIARQPIFDSGRHVIGYELLFRSSARDHFNHHDGDAASSQLVSDALSVFGIRLLTAGCKAFINFTRQGLLQGHAYLLPAAQVVVELLEGIEPDREVLQACRQLKRDGYTLALDDFQYNPKLEPLVELADIIKIDFRLATPEQGRRLGQQAASSQRILLAEKVETWQEYQEALAWGYQYFQGFFFCRPELLASKELLPSRLAVLRLLAELNRADVDLESVERIIKQDPPLSLKVIAYLNSALFGWQYHVTSIWRAVVLLGLNNLRRWISLFAMASLATDRPQELFRTCLVRARFCELLGRQAGLETQELDLFLIGLLSSIDAILGQPLEELLERLAVADDVHQALMSGRGPLGRIYALVQAYEQGDWDNVLATASALELADGGLVEAYLEALQWAADTSLQVHQACL